jgi:hypothetical protein
MKNIIPLLISFSALLCLACTKEQTDNMIVIRDCTGTYLQKEGKDYQVCNLEKVQAFADGAEVKASYKKLNECKGSGADQIVCMMYHQHEGWIEVFTIK